MAIGYNPMNIGFRLNKEEMGVPDLGAAIRSGYDTAFKPGKMATELLGQQLLNKINAAKAKYAEPREAAALQHARASLGLLGEQINAARQKAQMLKENPLFGAPGDLGKIGALIQMRNHPELFGGNIGIPGQENTENLPQDMQQQQDIEGLSPQQSYVPKLTSGSERTSYTPPVSLSDVIQQHILDSMSGGMKGGRLVGPAAEAMSLEKIRRDYGENSREYQTASQLAQLKQQTQESLNSQRNRRASGLRQGEEEVKDSSGTVIGYSTPYSAAEKKEESGRLFFNSVYPFTLQSTGYYSGQGSIRKFAKDAANYKTDKNAQRRIDNYLASIKLLPSSLVKENATVGGANTNQVYNRLVESLNASDMPKKVEMVIKQFGLPMEAQIRSGKIFSDILNEATDRKKEIPARKIEYLGGKRKGHIYNPRTKKLQETLVAPQHWDEFVKAGGY